MFYSSLSSWKAARSLFQAGPAQDKKHDFQQQSVGKASDTLKEKILEMYWNGVREELACILLNLHRWQTEPSFSEPTLDERVDDSELVQGYDAFLKNVCHDPRFNSPKDTDLAGYKARVEDTLRATKTVELWQKRALMLLQSAQFLDIDKLFEYRSSSVRFLMWDLSLWKTLSCPQLRLIVLRNRPCFLSKRCSECRCPIRSSSYHDTRNKKKVLCETCFRGSLAGETGRYQKHYKECCLPSCQTHKKAAQLCHCLSPHNDNEERHKSRWPLALEAKGGCWLFALNRLIAERKHSGTSETLLESKSLQKIKALDQKQVDKMNRSKRSTGQTVELPNLNSEFGHPVDFATSRGKTYSIEEPPLYLRSRKRNYPFGNVHVALRFGPLTFENGIAGTNGVIIDTRDPPQLQESKAAPSTGNRLMLTEKNLETQKLSPKSSWTRTLYQQQRPRDTKRYKAMAKQVVGGAFCGFIDQEKELEIADTLIREGEGLMLAGISDKLKQDLIRSSTKRVYEKVESYLSSRVDTYVDRIVKRLLDEEVALRWDEKKNSCQTFCDNIIDTKVFGRLFPPVKGAASSTPLYLMSFVCRSAAYIARGPGPMYNTPHGHVEEYLFKYRFGRHEESDIIDALQEYWHDWGNFEGFLYPHQDIFPWDCTEGFNESPHRCGNCNISKHVWAFPFDSFSLISLHLSRARHFYPKTTSPKKPYKEQRGDGDVSDLTATQGKHTTQGVMRDFEWFKNRVKLLMGQYSLLTGITAMAQCQRIRDDASWIWNETADDYIDRIKLGGIIRAQPFSHHFEKGSYYQYYVAGWTSLKLSDRIEQYEKLRDLRAQLGGGLPGLARSIQRKNGAQMRNRTAADQEHLELDDRKIETDTATQDMLEALDAAIYDLSVQTEHSNPITETESHGRSGGGGGNSGGGGTSGGADSSGGVDRWGGGGMGF